MTSERVCRCGHNESRHFNSAGRCSGGEKGARCGCVIWEPRLTSLDAAVREGEHTKLVCTKIVDGPMVPGVTERCATCHEVVTISPATFEVWKHTAEPKSIICNQCWLAEVVQRKEPVTIQTPTEGQLAEVREALRRDADNRTTG